jgi:hypothetical protein
MTPADLVRDFGKPVAYYPGLVKYLGSVNAVLMFCQLFYWTGKEASELGVYKSVEDIEAETGMGYREQATARKQLVGKGVLIETHKRLEHKIFFKIDVDVLNHILSGKTCNSPTAESAFREQQKRISGSAENADGGERKTHFDPTENTTENTTEINTPLPPQGEIDERILANAEKALIFYNEITKSRCSDATPFAELLTERKYRHAYTLQDITTVIRWVVNTWKPRNGTIAKPANICRINRFDGYCADAYAWAADYIDIDCEAVIAAYNEILGDRLPVAESDPDRVRAVKMLAPRLAVKSLDGFQGYFEAFSTARDYYFGGPDGMGWRANFDYLMKSETLRKTRERSL